jgi:hypothetical protein
MQYTGNRLLSADEGLNHQIVQTFATVGNTDLSWTEKVWATGFALDGSLQIDVGLGKYNNRNVMDAFAGVSRGKEQWTVRASRELSSDPETTTVGPIQYAVVDPLKRVRFVLDANDIQPIRFDITLTALLPAFFEEPDRRWDRQGLRIVSDLLRYHQPTRVDGWVEVDAERTELAGAWRGFRDHSWGSRRNVGVEPADVRQKSTGLADTQYRMHWAPLVLESQVGSIEELHYHIQDTSFSKIYLSGHVNTADGAQLRAWRVQPDVLFDPTTRRLVHGTVVFDLEDGSQRTVQIEPRSETGFYLGTGLYMDFRGEHHGSWRGKFHTSGEYIADCTEPNVLREVHQLRDCIVRVQDGDATGWGVFESIMTGGWPGSGLSATDSFV